MYSHGRPPPGSAIFYAKIYHPIQAGSIDGTDITPHDHGITRALAASWQYNLNNDTKAEGDPYCTLFVGRLSERTTESTLLEAMSAYGNVKRVRVVRDIVTGASRRYAFVEFETHSDMYSAFLKAHRTLVDGQEILVDYNRQRLMPGWIPRRLGGGLGGCKESGQLRFGGRDRPFRAPLRPVPEEELKALGIPAPSDHAYVSHRQTPPIPRPPREERGGGQGLERERHGSFKRHEGGGGGGGGGDRERHRSSSRRMREDGDADEDHERESKRPRHGHAASRH